MVALRRRSQRVSAERLKGRAVAVIVKAGARRLGWQGLPLPSILRPYLPQSAPLAGQSSARERIGFKQLANAFLTCAAPDRLQALANSLIPRDLVTCGQKWLAHLTPFFTAREREEAGCRHRLFFSQVEFCDNLVFRRRSALDKLGERLLDANRTIGQPKKITVIFGRKITKHYRGKLQTEIEDVNLPNPVICSHYGNGFIKQYVRDIDDLDIVRAVGLKAA
jgi:hypothetical protein